MYFYRLISALAFVSMVLAAAVPSPGSPADGPQLSSTNGATIEVTFSGHSADSKWTKTAQNDAQVGVIKTLRDAWEKNYHLQDVASKDVKFHGFVTKAQVVRPAFGADCYLFGGDCYLYTVKFSGARAHIGDCQGWVAVDLRDRPGAEKAIVSGQIESREGTGISAMRSMRYNSEDFKEGK